MTDLVMHCSKLRWKKLVDGVVRAIALPGLIKKSHITAIVVETESGTHVRFWLETNALPPKADGFVEEVPR